MIIQIVFGTSRQICLQVDRDEEKKEKKRI